MKAEVVSYSQPARKFLDQGLKTLQDLVVYKARVSNPTNQFNMLTGDKLVDYLIRNKHWSPLEMVSVCMEIETTRDIARQILRHRSFSFQEFSQRYAEVNSFSIRECRMQDTKNRQNSLTTDDIELQQWWGSAQARVQKEAEFMYQAALNRGIAKEQARALLPEGLAMSRMYMNGTLRSWLHYIEIRTDVATQKEHRDVALECKKALAELCPTIIKDFIQ
jgi:thymidylate synthase (FAD)